jgi:copper oxidase (laccase) domain-containing protein
LQNNELPLETFPALERTGYRHGFVRRVPGVELSNDKAIVLGNLDQVHRQARRTLGLSGDAFATGQQIHGDKIATIDSPLAADRCFEGCDGLITNQRTVCLGIYVADCCALYLVDRKRRGAALIHSGKKGTELGIVSKAIAQMREKFSIDPQDLIAHLSPCIRPPHYEIDFAAEIIRQCRAAGLEEVHDSGVCTACNLNAYYSYRAEKGRTGRMLALLAFANS